MWGSGPVTLLRGLWAWSVPVSVGMRHDLPGTSVYLYTAAAELTAPLLRVRRRNGVPFVRNKSEHPAKASLLVCSRHSLGARRSRVPRSGSNRRMPRSPPRSGHAHARGWPRRAGGVGTLGHCDIQITRSIHQSGPPDVGRSVAEATPKAMALECQGQEDKARMPTKRLGMPGGRAQGLTAAPLTHWSRTPAAACTGGPREIAKPPGHGE